MRRKPTAVIITAMTAMILTVLLLPAAGGMTALAVETTTTQSLVTTTSTWVLTGPDGTNTTLPPTTTTGWDCISTPPPTTTSTTWVLTGPDGINPDYTTVTTTTAPSVCGDINDILSNADISVSDTMALLGHPRGGHWLSADCYSYDGGTVTITPNDAALNDGYDYMHLTIIANVPFSVAMEASGCFANPMMWFPESAQQDDGYITEGAYVLSGDVTSAWTDPNPIDRIVVTLSAPGSVTVGHLALSNESTCHESAPRIQTTTRPSFPWDDTTVPPTTTTNPTTGDALLPGDADNDGILTTSDARVILMHCLLGSELGENGKILADYNGDGYVTTLDTRMILMSLIV